MSTPFTSRTIGVSCVVLFLANPPAVNAAYTSIPTAGETATMTGDAASDTLTITQSVGLFRHNRFTAGDPGFNSDFDFNTAVVGDQTLPILTGIININAGDGNDTIVLDDGIDVRGPIDGGPGTDTLVYSAFTTAMSANLGLGTTGLGATIGADQENPATSHAGTGTATVSNYNIVTHTFDITVTTTGLPPAEVTGFHIHQGAVRVNGPIIVDFGPLGGLTPVGTGFTFTATGLTLPAISEAAFLGGGTYVNIHTAVFPGGAIRGQLFSGSNVNLGTGAATGATAVTNMENVTGGTGGDSLVGNSLVNTINGGSGDDWIVGGAGSDVLNGGAGVDVLVWSNGDGTDVVEGGTESDTLQVSGSTASPDIFTVSANGTRTRLDRLSPGPFSLDIGTVETLTVNGIGGNDTFTVNDLTGVASLATLNLYGFDDADNFTPGGASAVVAFNVNGGPGADTLDYSAFTTAVSANLGLGTTGLAATLGAGQENPATAHAGTGTATVTNYNVVTHTFDITVTTTGLPPADVTGFHIHQGAVRVNGPIIVDFTSLGGLTPAGTGFTFTATGLTLPAVSEAAFLGGGTYVNIHTAMFPGGAIRGQLFSGGNVNLASTGGAATGTSAVTGIENVTGGMGNDSLVGNFLVNTINGGPGEDWIVVGPGDDVLDGGAGADVLVWSNGDGTDVVEGGTENDTAQVNGSTASADIFTVSANGARTRLDRTNLGVFNLDIGTVETLTVNGIAGDDTFTVNDLTGVASLATLRLNGFDGMDTFNVKAFASGTPSVNGGASTDTLNYDAQSRTVSGDTTPPDGLIDSPGVQSVTFTQIETVNIINRQLFFTDPTLTPGLTTIKAVHINELRARVNDVRAARGLGAFSFSDSPLLVGVTLIRAVHVLELRTALDAAYAAAGSTPPTYSDPVPGPGVQVMATAIMELRAAVIAIE